jgi:hypothetical protein
MTSSRIARTREEVSDAQPHRRVHARCLAIRVDRKLKAADVIDVLSDQFILRGVPEHIRSDNGPEFLAKAVQDWIGAVGAKTAYIERGNGVSRCMAEYCGVQDGLRAAWMRKHD